ncbi:MAG: hypothetical protein IIT32_09765 [Bacteroidales bacterium]|nr:hypothetical protein [Bacteroidales bacterium]
MKNTLFAAIFSTSILLTACGGSGSNNGNGDGGNASNADATIAATPAPKSVDSNVDWEKPLYVINDKGDTLETWTYNDKGYVIRNCSRYDLIDDCDYKYDEQGRLIWKYCLNTTGNDHESEYKYAYKGNVRIGEGSEMAEGWQSYFDVKEITYYLDTECKYDTLTENYEMEIPWDDADNPHNHDITDAKPSNYVTKQYKKFGDKYLVVEEKSFRRDYDDESKLINSFRFIYEYNDKGLLTKETEYDSNQKLSATITYEYNADNLIIKKTYDNGTNKTVTTYTYNDNVQTETNSEGTFKTFYQQK